MATLILMEPQQSRFSLTGANSSTAAVATYTIKASVGQTRFSGSRRRLTEDEIDAADIAEAERRLSNPDEVPRNFDDVCKELGLD